VVGPRASLDDVEKRTTLPLREFEMMREAKYEVLSRYFSGGTEEIHCVSDEVPEEKSGEGPTNSLCSFAYSDIKRI
jgi:hypothetical protein